MASYHPGGPQPPASDDSPEYAGAAEPAETPESAPRPWYRNRALLIAWGAVVAILVVLIIYGLIQLSHGVEGGPSETTPSTTPSTTPAGSSTTTPPSTTTPSPPPSSTPEPEGPPAGNAPPPPAQSPAPAAPPEHHHHVPHIPSTIPLPHTVITLPHGF
jgi:hypothetical protein